MLMSGLAKVLKSRADFRYFTDALGKLATPVDSSCQ